jgi:hypothetical protein
MYLRIINDIIIYPYTIQQLREAYPNISIPSQMEDSILNEWDMWNVVSTPMPTDYTKNIVEGTPILINEIYTQTWNQTDASEAEINLRIENKWIEIRQLRDSLLFESDWTQLSDSPQSANNDWKTYRQSLRDITSQSNPFNINWPVKP